MSKFKSILIFSIIIVCCVVAIFFGGRARQSREPSYQGRSLSSWLGDFSIDANTVSNAEIAMRIMGTNALPFLLERLSYEDSPTRRKISTMMEKLPFRFTFFEPKITRNIEAANAINAIGPAAESVYSPLTNLFYSGKPTAAGFALAGLGKKGTSFLVSNLTNQNLSLRNTSALALGSARSDFDMVVPALIEVLNDDASMARSMAAMSLGLLHQSPSLVIPALLNNLNSSNEIVRRYVGIALGEYGTNAQAAIPMLIKMTSDENEGTRELAKQVLQKIAPETSNKKEPK